MNKLEQAIRKIVDEDAIQSSIFSKGTDSISEIEKMETNFILDNDSLVRKKIIFPNLKKSELVNTFRELRMSLAKSNGSITMVTSICKGAGVSFFSRNLAASISFDSAKTSLLIDCNISAPGDIATTFDMKEKQGISDYIAGVVPKIEDIIYESGIKRLRLVPFGQKLTSVDEYFSHPRFHLFLDDIKNRYKDRNIIIDAPPILMSADARVLLNICDQAILIVPNGKGSKLDVEGAAKIIGKDRLIGAVFNDFIK